MELSRSEIGELTRHIDSLRTRAEAAEAERDELRRVLEMVEWEYDSHCCWCRGYGYHHADCPRQKALGLKQRDIVI